VGAVSSSLRELLDGEAIARLAGARSLERGEEYVKWGAVGRLRIAAESVAATVQGTHPYEVRIGVEDGRLAFACSCPVRMDGAFCKHCVAVALCWLGEGMPAGPTRDVVRAYLLSLDREQLVELLVEHARDDERLDERLQRLVVRHANGAGDVAAYRAFIDRAFAVHGFVAYRDAYNYFAGITETVDALDELLADGRAEAVVELAEHALRALAGAVERVDDSDGGTGEVVERLEELHRQACLAARPDPVALAERLLDWELESELDIFDRAAVRYADVLGEAGLDRYRELAEVRWSAVPALRPGDSDRGGNGERFRITRIMEALAELSGDLDQQVAVRSRDLSDGYAFLRLAELCLEHDRPELALRWAERGLAAFLERPDPRLRAFVADRYRHADRRQEALELSRLAFADRPGLETYTQLKAGRRTPRRVARTADRGARPAARAHDSTRAPARQIRAPSRPLRTRPHLPLGRRRRRRVGGSKHRRLFARPVARAGGPSPAHSPTRRARRLRAPGRADDRRPRQARLRAGGGTDGPRPRGARRPRQERRVPALRCERTRATQAQAQPRQAPRPDHMIQPSRVGTRWAQIVSPGGPACPPVSAENRPRPRRFEVGTASADA
jgi:uncharacterized Zn finger protein